MGSGCADGRNNCSINGAVIVEGNTDGLLNVLGSGGVEGFREVWGGR